MFGIRTPIPAYNNACPYQLNYVMGHTNKKNYDIKNEIVRLFFKMQTLSLDETEIESVHIN